MDDATLSRDAFLGGRLTIWQPRDGYRAATDPILLAAAAGAKAGDRVLELGCGAGTAVLALMTRVAGLHATGLEVQPHYARLAGRNAADNGLLLEVVTGDVTAMPSSLRGETFDLVITNPPWFQRGSASPAAERGRDIARRQADPPRDWIDAALRRLKPGGQLTVIHRTEALPAILAALGQRAGDIRILPVAARAGEPAGRVIVTARKGRRSPLVLLAPLLMHSGDGYTKTAESILRDMQPILTINH